MRRLHRETAARFPYEACGLLVGSVRGGTVRLRAFFPLTNVLRSRNRFAVRRDEISRVLGTRRRSVVAFYHSHPHVLALSRDDVGAVRVARCPWLVGVLREGAAPAALRASTRAPARRLDLAAYVAAGSRVQPVQVVIGGRS